VSQNRKGRVRRLSLPRVCVPTCFLRVSRVWVVCLTACAAAASRPPGAMPADAERSRERERPRRREACDDREREGRHREDTDSACAVTLTGSRPRSCEPASRERFLSGSRPAKSHTAKSLARKQDALAGSVSLYFNRHADTANSVPPSSFLLLPVLSEFRFSWLPLLPTCRPRWRSLSSRRRIWRHGEASNAQRRSAWNVPLFVGVSSVQSVWRWIKQCSVLTRICLECCLSLFFRPTWTSCSEVMDCYNCTSGIFGCHWCPITGQRQWKESFATCSCSAALHHSRLSLSLDSCACVAVLCFL
jgi:hypothetical protein